MSDCVENTYRGFNQDGANESACIDVMRIYDSCEGKDCLEDLSVYFSPANQQIINDATCVRIRSAEILDVYVDVEPVTFHKGYYNVNATFYFYVSFDVTRSPNCAPVPVCGLCIFTKQTVMYGCEGGVRRFSSRDKHCCPYTLRSHGETVGRYDCDDTGSGLPTAYVQTAEPMALSARLLCKCHKKCSVCECIPECILNAFGGELSNDGEKQVLATIGLFTIIQLARNVQILVPAGDCCLPCKECRLSSDSPCEMFSKIEFPSREFFPSCNHRKECNTDCCSCDE